MPIPNERVGIDKIPDIRFNTNLKIYLAAVSLPGVHGYDALAADPHGNVVEEGLGQLLLHGLHFVLKLKVNSNNGKTVRL